MMSTNNNSQKSKSGHTTPSKIMDSIDLSKSDSGEEKSGMCSSGIVKDRVPIFEVVYQDRRKGLEEELQNLLTGKHNKYLEGINKLEFEKDNNMKKNNMQMQLELDAVEKDYLKECQKIKEDMEKQRQKVHENLIAQLDEKKNTLLALMAGKKSMELQLDTTDHVTLPTRKLRRRTPNVVPLEKHRKSSACELLLNNCMLKKHEIKEDLEVIQGSSFSVNATEKKELPQSSSKDMKINTPIAVSNTKIVSGKLLFEKKWFLRGQTIYVEERPDEKFPAIIVSISKDSISVRKIFDNNEFTINLFRLLNGEVNITRRAL